MIDVADATRTEVGVTEDVVELGVRLELVVLGV